MKTLKTMLGENVYLVKMSNKDGKTMVRQYRAPSILSAESKAKVDAKLRGYSVESVRELSKEKDDLDEAKYVSSADYELSASGRKVHKRKKIADDDYDKEDEVEDENEKEKKESFNFDSMEQIEEDVWYCGEDLDLQLDEAQQRYSSSYQFTHKPGDAESEKKLSGLKKMVKGTGKRVVLMGRLGKDNPNAHKYKKGGEVSSNRSQFAGTHKYIKKGDAAHHDVYVYDRRESVEHIEEATVKKANYSWGKMMTVHHGADHSYPLHPEHQEAIRKLKHGEKTSFKDETGTKVTVHRDSDEVHFTSNRSANKTIVAHSHFKESVEIDEAVSSGNAQHALANSEYSKHAAYMKKTHGVETKYHGTDELSYHGNKASVKKALINHYDNEEEAKALHPKVFKESVELDEAVDPQESRFFQLARLGLVDKADVTKLRMAMGQLNSDKALSIKQRELLLSTFQSLVDIVTGDDAIFTRVRMDVQKEETKPSVHTKKYHQMYGEGIDFDKIRADAADHIKKSIDKQSDDRIAAAKNPQKKPGFFARVGQKQINMVKGAYHGLTKEGKDEIPFEGPYTKVKDVVTDKSGGKHTPMSRVRHLARMALKKQAEKK